MLSASSLMVLIGGGNTLTVSTEMSDPPYPMRRMYTPITKDMPPAIDKVAPSQHSRLISVHSLSHPLHKRTGRGLILARGRPTKREGKPLKKPTGKGKTQNQGKENPREKPIKGRKTRQTMRRHQAFITL